VLTGLPTYLGDATSLVREDGDGGKE